MACCFDHCGAMKLPALGERDLAMPERFQREEAFVEIPCVGVAVTKLPKVIPSPSEEFTTRAQHGIVS